MRVQNNKVTLKKVKQARNFIIDLYSEYSEDLSDHYKNSLSDVKLKLGLYRERITRKQLQYHLLNNPDPIYGGKLMAWRNKHIGAGIYEIWIEEKKAN